MRIKKNNRLSGRSQSGTNNHEGFSNPFPTIRDAKMDRRIDEENPVEHVQLERAIVSSIAQSSGVQLLDINMKYLKVDLLAYLIGSW